MDQRSARRAPEAPLRECEPNGVYAPHGLAQGISALAAEPTRLTAMATAARTVGRLDAAERLADLVVKVAGI